MRNQKGFTLVEIAIVLVIVGLLLGGVLKGQAMIGTAKTNSLIKKLESLQTAYYAFQDKYSAVPGDMANASSIIGGNAVDCTTSCDNGLIDSGWRNTSLVFSQLSAAGLYSGPFSISENNSQPTTTDYLNNSFGGGMFIRYFNQFASTSASRSNVTVVHTGRRLTADILAEIDRKIDDGFPQTGKFRASWPDINGSRCYDNSSNTWSLGATDCGGALSI